MRATWPRPSSAISRSSRPSICPSIDVSSTPSFTSSRPSPPTRSTRSSPSSSFSPAISSKPLPENPLSGLFYYLRIPGLPATNNDLEQFFGAQRYHERRTTGRKVASPSLVVRGSVLAVTLTRLAPISAQDLAAVDLAKWRETLGRLKQRHHARVPLPPQSGGIPRRPRTTSLPTASFAALEKKPARR